MYGRLIDTEYCLSFIDNQVDIMEWEIRVSIYLILVLVYIIYKLYRL